VRILRVARFAARFKGFTVAPETLALMQSMVEAGEVDHLVPERVWQEISRGLLEEAPMRMFEVLETCGALARCVPEVHERMVGEADGLARSLDCAVRHGLPLAERWALLFGDDESAAESASARIRVPQACRDLAVLLARLGRDLASASSARDRLDVMGRTDAFRRPERLTGVMAAAACRLELPVFDRDAWRAALAAARGVDGGAVARKAGKTSDIPAAIYAARLEAIESVS